MSLKERKRELVKVLEWESGYENSSSRRGFWHLGAGLKKWSREDSLGRFLRSSWCVKGKGTGFGERIEMKEKRSKET